VEDHYDAEIFQAETKANTDLTHFHIGLFAGPVVDHNPVAATEAGQDEIDVGVTEYGIARSIGYLRSDIRLVLKGVLLHTPGTKKPAALSKETAGFLLV